ncbi:hypothetical protein BV510_03400 [Mycolicibacterium diernhoferi]|uniref:Terminase n=1 Tax=Mycolicibacterium diernhoferi TaxID=1801 RepID=A0A1T3WMX7_9MYCO|nr:hypothetical protein BV510_03400 [Mycolicibacterium diernhoferi]
MPKYPTGLKARGRRLWRELHEAADFGDSPEARLIAEEACYLADEIERLRRIVRKAGADTRVTGYNGQPVSMPEADDLRKNQGILLSMIKSLRLPDDDDTRLTRSEIGKRGADARWGRRSQ